jgi:GTPase SAR1 family protein
MTSLTYTGVVSGLPESGKTAWINAISGGVFDQTYTPSKGTVKYEIPINTTAGPINLVLYECNSEELCGSIYSKADFWLFFVAPEQINQIPPLKDYPNMKSRIIVISQSDRLNKEAVASYQMRGNYSVISTKDNFNIYDPLNKAFAAFPNNPKIVLGSYGPFIILLIGNESAGKTSWLQSLSGMPMATERTLSPRVFDASITTSKGKILFTLYDCPGIDGDNWGNQCDRLFPKADGIFLMVDSMDIPLGTLNSLKEKITKKAPNVPVQVVYTKDDQLSARSKRTGNVLTVSAVKPDVVKNENAFLEISRQILNDPNLM